MLRESQAKMRLKTRSPLVRKDICKPTRLNLINLFQTMRESICLELPIKTFTLLFDNKYSYILRRLSEFQLFTNFKRAYQREKVVLDF